MHSLRDLDYVKLEHVYEALNPDAPAIRIGSITLHDDGCTIAKIQWNHDTGEVIDLFVKSAYRREGWATRLFRFAQAGYDVKHSKQRTRDGQAWALSLGEELPDWEPI